jgi:fido (protein-threonine AMPylation protein)
MTELTKKQQKIIEILLKNGESQSSTVFEYLINLGEDVSLVTIKRALSELASHGFLTVKGMGRSLSYIVSDIGRLFFDVDSREYCSIDPDKRYGSSQYNFNLFNSISDDIFSEEELNKIEETTNRYKLRSKELSATIQKKELERFIIELSWKSSKIEGNTYTLLDTEKLILENKKAEGKTKEETQMILNHKEAFNFIYKNSNRFKTITKDNLEELHVILTKDLGVDKGFRKNMVGTTGSIYRPLDNIYQIEDATESLISAVSKIKNPFAKALLSLIGISYIQPFGDGNKRTSRLMANAILLAYNLPPLSYRSTDEDDFRDAILSFYELNSIVPIKKIFIEQYRFTAENYTII